MKLPIITALLVGMAVTLHFAKVHQIYQGWVFSNEVIYSHALIRVKLQAEEW